MQTKHIEQIKAALDEIVPVANLGALVSKNDRLQCVKDSLSALEGFPKFRGKDGYYFTKNLAQTSVNAAFLMLQTEYISSNTVNLSSVQYLLETGLSAALKDKM